MVYNISSKGLKVVVSPKTGGSITLDDFPDDSSPVSISPLEENSCKFDINGEIVPFSKAGEWSVSVSAIPGSKNDGLLMALAMSSTYMGVDYEQKGVSMTVENFVLKADLSEGRMQTGGGAEAQSSGRWKGNVYTFFFKNNKISAK